MRPRRPMGERFSGAPKQTRQAECRKVTTRKTKMGRATEKGRLASCFKILETYVDLSQNHRENILHLFPPGGGGQKVQGLIPDFIRSETQG